MTKISVIIPVYNVEPYLARCLDSVCNQTLKDIEIICINDCSPDNSLAILKEYASKDNRIKIIDFKENKNAAVARNAGLEVAKGEYLGFVDPDDYIDLNFYEELYNKAIEDNADIAKCECKIYETNGKIAKSELNSTIKKDGKYFFTSEWWTAIYKSSMVFDNNIKLPEECPKAQDIVFQNRCVLQANKVAIVDNIFYNYVKREGSLDAKKIPLDAIKSVLRAKTLICEEINNSSLLNEDREVYIKLFASQIEPIASYIYFQNDSYEAKLLCAEKLICCFTLCKESAKLKKEFRYSFLLPYIEDEACKLADELTKYNSYAQLLTKQLRENTKSNKNA